MLWRIFILITMLFCGCNQSGTEDTSGTFVIRKNTFQPGKKIFNAHCAFCHRATAAKMIGPGLKDMTKKHEMEWLYKWIHSSQELINSGDSAAMKVFTDYNKSICSDYPYLTNSDIDTLFFYIDSLNRISPAN